MPWRQRFIDYLSKERDDLERRIAHFDARRCEVWEAGDGKRRDVTEEFVGRLRNRLAEIEQMLVEEGLS